LTWKYFQYIYLIRKENAGKHVTLFLVCKTVRRKSPCRYTCAIKRIRRRYARIRASQVALVVKNLPANAGDFLKRRGFDPWIGKILRRRAWQPTAVFLQCPGESHGQRNLAGYSP